MDHVNKIKILAGQLVCLEVTVRMENIFMILFKSLPDSYEYLITALKKMLMKELMMHYVTTHLMHEISKYNEKEPQDEDVAMVFQPSKGGNSFLRQGTKSCFYYSE